jgi:signal transduction histidine kinase/CheY-like chemotaxis protein/HPt (histidine-containing phosphotransfer) domain-containing protein
MQKIFSPILFKRKATVKMLQLLLLNLSILFTFPSTSLAKTDEFSIYNTINSFLQDSKESLQEEKELSKKISEYVLKLSQKNNFSVGEIKALQNLGSYYKKKNDFKMALKHQFDALKKATAINHLELISESHYLIGDIYKALGNYKKGSEYFLKSVGVRQDLKDTLGLVKALNKLGHINMDQIGLDTIRNEIYFNTGLNYYNQAFALNRLTNNLLEITSSYLNLGNAYLAIGSVTKNQSELKKSIDMSLKALEMNATMGNYETEGVLYLNIAEAYEYMSLFNLTNKYNDKAIHIFSKPQKPYFLSHAYVIKGRVFASQNQYKNAIKYLEQAYSINEKSKSIYGLKQTSNLLSTYYSKIGDNYNAYRYQLLNTNYNNLIFDNQSDLNIARLQIAFETETKDKEIALLQKNQELQKAKLEQQKTMRNYLIFCFGIVLICLCLVVRQNHLRKAQNKLIEVKNKELEKLSIVASKTLNGVMIVDEKGDVIWINEGFSKLYGWQSLSEFSQVCGDNIFKMPCFEKVKERIQEAIAAKSAFIFESDHETSLKGKRTIQSSFTPIFSDQGKLEKMVFVDSDVTEINKAKITAEKALLIQEQFIANTSHEIRTPMNGVLGMLRKLKTSNLNNDQEEIVSAILDSSNNLMYVVNDILDISKIKAGKIVFEKTPFKIEEICQSLSNNLRFRAEEKNITFAIDKEGIESDFLLGDPIRLNQILLNLAGNAIKFTDHGFVKIEINCVINTAEKQVLEFIVKDTGIGIAKEKLSQIFENFTQAEQHITSKYGGTGLGLSIAKYLVEIQGGHIQVISEIGKGSSFSFTLAFEKSMEQAQHIAHADYLDQEIDLSDLKILVVDDNMINQKVATYELENWGIQVDTVASGEDAIEKVSSSAYHLVLMDIAMPGMDGLTATHIIRQGLNIDEKQLPIIAMTASALIGDRDKCLRSGMNDFISKPFDPMNLYAKIVKWTKGKDVYVPINATSSQDELITLDLKIIHDRAAGSDEYVLEMIELFEKEMPTYVSELLKYSEIENWNQIYSQVHKMKSPVAYFGCANLLKVLHEIEGQKSLKDTNHQVIKSNIYKIPELMEQVMVALELEKDALVTV